MDTVSHIDVNIIDVNDVRDLGALWEGLEAKANASYFLSWGWIGNWVHNMPASIKPWLLIAKSEGKVIGLAVVVFNKTNRKGLFLPSRSLFAHQVGDMSYDTLTIEYNDLLVDRHYECEATKALLCYLKDNISEWDELFINGICETSAIIREDIGHECDLNLQINAELPSWYVDLAEIRNKGEEYLTYLSSNTRYQLRRMLKECEKYGILTISSAQTVSEAQNYLDALIKYHQDRWNNKGKPGSFANKFFEEFHRSLINNRFEFGEIQLLKISLSGNEIGYIYNLVKNGYVNFYQSGFNYNSGIKIKPGYISHYMAIIYNLEHGECIYDFLASECQYKRSLSTKSNNLMWVSLQRNRVKFMVERCIRKLTRAD